MIAVIMTPISQMLVVMIILQKTTNNGINGTIISTITAINVSIITTTIISTITTTNIDSITTNIDDINLIILIIIGADDGANGNNGNIGGDNANIDAISAIKTNININIAANNANNNKIIGKRK